jgi:hypothetical protein
MMVALHTDPLPSWRETPTKQSIIDFVAAVTAPDSDAAVPEVDRVAVFDNDGTLGFLPVHRVSTDARTTEAAG